MAPSEIFMDVLLQQFVFSNRETLSHIYSRKLQVQVGANALQLCVLNLELQDCATGVSIILTKGVSHEKQQLCKTSIYFSTPNFTGQHSSKSK